MAKFSPVYNPIPSNKVKNLGGSIVYAGNVSAGENVNALGLSTVAYHPGHVGAAIPHALVQGDLTNKTASLHNCGRWQPYQAAGATYGVMNAGEYLIRRAGKTNYLAGIATSLLDSGCSDFGARNSFHAQKRDRYAVMYQMTIAFGQAGAMSGGTNVLTFSYDDGTTVWQNDSGVTTRAVPGFLVYRVASTAFVTKQYLAANT